MPYKMRFRLFILSVLLGSLSLSGQTIIPLSTQNRKAKKHYQKAEYYISIPNSDATSVSLLEAMQYGAIPIVSNIPANREWILDGVNGIYFDDNKKLNEMKTEENFAKINQNILKSKALFPKSIKDFVYKVIT